MLRLCFPFEPPTAPCVAMGDGAGPAPSPRRVDDSTLLPCQTVSPWLRLQRLCRGGALRFAADAYKAMQRVWDLTNSHGLRWLLRVQVVCHLPTSQLSKQCVCVCVCVCSPPTPRDGLLPWLLLLAAR